MDSSNAFAAPVYEPPESARQPQTRQLTDDEIAQGCKLDPFLGMRVKRLWPEVTHYVCHPIFHICIAQDELCLCLKPCRTAAIHSCSLAAMILPGH